LTTTTNLGLTTYSSESGSLTSFLDYRLATAGTTTSNLITLDRWAGETSGSLNSLKTNAIFTVLGTAVSTNYYVATVANLSSYSLNPTINLKINVSVTGSTTLNINSLGDIILKKVNTGGTIVNLASGDMIANQYYIFAYNGSNFVMVSGGAGTSSSGLSSSVPVITVIASSELNNYAILGAGSNVTITSPSASGGSIIINAIGGFSSIAGSGIMSNTGGSVVVHNISSVSPGSYLATNLTVDSTGHITLATNGVSASSVGAPSDSPFVTSASTPDLTNYRIITAGSNITFTSSSVSGGNLIINSSGGGSGGSSLEHPISPYQGIVPALSSLTWDNQASCSAVEPTTGGIRMAHAANAINECYMLYKNLTSGSSGNYRITIMIIPMMYTSYNRAGLGIRESSSGKIIGCNLMTHLTKPYICAHLWTTSTSWYNNYIEIELPLTPQWLQLEDNGTNLIFRFSNDGTYFINFHTVSRTDFMTADQCGFFIENENGSSPDVSMWVRSWKEENI
jgi:hypothetical protein